MAPTAIFSALASLKAATHASTVAPVVTRAKQKYQLQIQVRSDSFVMIFQMIFQRFDFTPMSKLQDEKDDDK